MSFPWSGVFSPEYLFFKLLANISLADPYINDSLIALSFFVDIEVKILFLTVGYFNKLGLFLPCFFFFISFSFLRMAYSSEEQELIELVD